MIKSISSFKHKLALFFALFTFSALTYAAPITIDSTEIVTTISSVITVISAVGMAVISIAVTIKLFQWVKSAIR